jgi:3-oxoacyl-[acyl-carrier-protein] synthase-3
LIGWARFDAEARVRDSVMALKQDVRLLNERVTEVTLERPLPSLARKYKLEPEDVHHFLPHYSSEFFRPRLHQAMLNVNFDIPQERWFTNLSIRGNTGSASMYIMIDELLSSGRVERGERVLCWVPESGRFTAAFVHLTAV